MLIDGNFVGKSLHLSLIFRIFVLKIRDDMKAMYKNELAEAAGVSMNTFRRWLGENRGKLARLGVRPRQQLLPPKAVTWICREYGIDC